MYVQTLGVYFVYRETIVGCVSVERYLGIQCGCGQTLMLSVGINRTWW